ncbi:Iron reductase [Mycena sanguinolenta]|uniref:ferric-chelate reductase (NADPH) n=1 Tax=Mycena sanguinolenta TaxID=230812 RepID=A0A8H6ZJR6_9AGAR|nr:Iron reductase [Mycena sanguinolenta]
MPSNSSVVSQSSNGTVVKTATTQSTVDVSAFVYHVNIFILALAAAVLLYRLPRALARFWRATEWTNGHFFHRIARPTPLPKVMMLSRGASSKKQQSDISHTDFSHAKFARRIDASGVPVRVSYPPHVAACTPLLRPLASPLSIRISPGFTIAHLMVCLVYLSILIYPLSVATAGPLVDLDRTGWIATSQLPLVVLFASKNNLLGMMLGNGYTSLNFFHRFSARVFILCCNAHGLGYIFKWAQAGNFKLYVKTPANTHGLLALVALNFMFYRIFVSTHILGFAIFLPGLWFHKAQLHPYIYVTLGFFALDHLLRLVKTRMYNAVIRPLPDMGTTRIEVGDLNAGWRAGQHVRLRILTGALGLTGWAESHPFTIASVSGSPEGLVLMVKKSGDWTNKLFDFAKSGGYTEAGVGRNVSVILEGPYGGMGHMMPHSYSAAVFVVGGSGISFAMAAIQDLIDKDLRGQSRVKIIELIWTVQDPAALLPLYPLFNNMIAQAVFTRMRISVFYTRAPIGKFPFADSAFPSSSLSLSPGRPRLASLLENSISRTVKLGAGKKDEERLTGMLVGVCGPVGLADSVAEAISELEPLRRDQVGGVEVYSEAFGL